MASGIVRRRGGGRGAARRRHVTRPGSPATSGGSSDTFVLRDHRKLRRAPGARAVRPGAAPLPADDRRASSSACSASTTRSPSRACAGSSTEERKRAGVTLTRPRPRRRSTDWRTLRMSDAGDIERPTWPAIVVRGPDRHDALRRPRARPHHRRRRRSAPTAAPASASSPARPSCSCRRATAASCSTTSSASSAARATSCATRRARSPGRTPRAATAWSSAARDRRLLEVGASAPTATTRVGRRVDGRRGRARDRRCGWPTATATR